MPCYNLSCALNRTLCTQFRTVTKP